MNTGSRVRIERHQSTDAGTTRLFLPGGGMVEVPSEAIQRFEADEWEPPPPPPTPRAAAPTSATDGDLERIVKSSSERHGLDADLIHSVIRAESSGNPRAVSPKGAGGLMQLMPETARELNVGDRFDPQQNVDGGTRYLRYLLGLYNNDLQLALAAYNAGPEKVAAYKGIPPYRETRQYVTRVIREFNKKKSVALARQ